MSDLITIPRTDWRQMQQEIKQIKHFVESNDMLNREQACELLNISSKTLTNYLALGKITPDGTNELGQIFFSRKKLVGL